MHCTVNTDGSLLQETHNLNGGLDKLVRWLCIYLKWEGGTQITEIRLQFRHLCALVGQGIFFSFNKTK